ncbi:MAG TPA: PQQ-binding-like beta-propeller repeat protein [Jatrophihabitans sp.]|nr:PQQ-binding-like beta-propeller repeat protein [Jatrophihabitans sp.]
MGQTRRRLVLALVAALTVAACSSGAGTHAPAPVASSPSPAASGVPDPVPSSSAPTSETAGTDWPEYHGDAQRSGVSAGMPAASGRLTARGVTLDGQVYASPVIAGGTVVVATETNHVYGLTLTGDLRWQQQLGSPTQRSALPCGNIDPLGITGTPIVRGGTVYLVASVGDTVSHQLYALDLASGAVRWHRSVDVPGADPQAMQQRGALAVAGGRVWVPFGGLAGDCGNYKGRVVGVPLAGGEPTGYTVPTGREGGIWTAPGPTVLADDLLVAVGNGESTGAAYDYSDSVLRLRGSSLIDSFSPSSWASDNAHDLDLGSQGPALVNQRWIFSAGKSGTGYVLAADHLGGIGGQVWQGKVCRSFGGTAVAGSTVFVPCTDGIRAVRIDATGTAQVLWRADSDVTGSPVVGGGRVYAISSAKGRLYALDPVSGRVREEVAIGPVSRFATPAISGDRLYLPTLTGLAVISTG